MRWFPIIVATLLGACYRTDDDAFIVDSVNDVPSAQEMLSNRLTEINIGMPLDEFRVVFPESFPGGQSRRTTAYEVAVRIPYVIREGMANTSDLTFHIPSRHVTKALWFYFYDDVLVQWGRPNDWPKDPDIIFEQRKR